MSKPKSVNCYLCDREREYEPYDVLRKVVRAWHPDLAAVAEILIFWREFKPDKDGKQTWGRAVIPNDVQKQLREHDLQIHLDSAVWAGLSAEEKMYLLDHECSHFVRDRDKETEELKDDENGRPVFRLRKHDFEDFRAVMERHGNVALVRERKEMVLGT